VKFGVCLPNFGPLASRLALVEGITAAEGAGFASVWLGDHLFGMRRIQSRYPYSDSGKFPVGPDSHWFEAVTTIAFLAARTSTVSIGTSVLVLPYRNPLVLAKELATAAVLSEGRLILGVGVGWMKEEFEVLGADFAHRGSRTNEAIQVLRTLWRDATPHFQGHHFAFTDLTMNPKPPEIPILVGGQSRLAYQRVVALGDGWLGVGQDPEQARKDVAEIQKGCAHVGRDPSSFRIYLARGVAIEPRPVPGTERRALHGSLDQIREDVARYAEAGVEHLILFPYREFHGVSVDVLKETFQRLGAALIVQRG